MYAKKWNLDKANAGGLMHGKDRTRLPPDDEP